MHLAIELQGVVIATLEGGTRSFDLRATEEGIERFGINSTVLSVIMPLVRSPRRDRAGRRRNWFDELLPEGDQYDHMLAQASLKEGDTPAFLARYGRDIAGALQVWDLDDPAEPPPPSCRTLDDTEVRELLEDPMTSPLANHPHAGKTSLGGVQPKIALARTETGWAQALGGLPTTHIIKPRLTGALASTIFDEEYGARLARRLSLLTFDTTIERFAGLDALVIERFDRREGLRVHQEDFSQILGAHGPQKYQEIGGRVSLRRVADVLQRFTSAEDLRRLARMVVLAVGIGNLDMHTKNLGLLHQPVGEIGLAPAYDLVPQGHRPGDGRMALAVNRRYRHADLTRDDLVAELTTWGLRRAEHLVDETLARLNEAIEAEEPLPGAHPEVKEYVRRYTTNLVRHRPAGA